MKTFIALLVVASALLSSCSDSNVTVSTGNNFEVVELPDGSIAYLNSNSFIEYNKNFNQREVQQGGEVFFVVKEGKSQFLVKTNESDIVVLGTEFNVRSTAKEIEVEVEEGIVELKKGKLVASIEKGQKAFFRDIKNGIEVGKADLHHKMWMRDMEKEFKKLGREFNKGAREFEKDSKKLGKKLIN